MILPTVLHNRAGGASYLITPEGTAAIYYANNRDADGTATLPVASQYVGGDYLHSLWNDFWLSPLRFAELELHKVGLYLSKNEPGNDLSYPLSGAAVSPLLRADPFNFSILVMLACFGGWAAWCGVGVRDPEARRSGRQAAGLFALVALTMAATTLLIWVEGRIRTAAIVALIPLGAQGIVAAGSAMQAAWRGWRLGRNVPQWRDLARAAIAIIGIALLMLAGQFAEDHLPLPVTASDLPASAQPLHALFDNNLELLGWQVQDQYSAQGVIRPFVPYVIAVYWRLRQPTSIDYSFAFGFYLNGDRLLGYDHPVGTVSFPARPTSTWPAGQIRVEYLATTWRQFTGPFEQSGDLFLSVYPNRDALHLLPAANLPDQPDHIRLARPAIMIGSGALPADWPHDQPPVTFSGANGDALSLISWRAPGGSAVIAGQPLTFDFGWQSGDQPIRASYTFGIYALDASQQVAVQTDSLLHQGALLSSSLPPHYRLPDTMTLKAPGTAGTYTLALVIYDSLTHERLQAPGLVNGLFTLGTITVQ